MTGTGWQFWIDRGGTFTDVIGYGPDNTLHSLKLLSDNPEHYADAAAEGIRRVLAATRSHHPVDEIRMGTTVATNALLQRKGATTGLLITRGFRDALRIGYQNRPNIFDLEIKLPQPLYTRVAEIDERMDASGTVLEALDESALETILTDWQGDKIRSVAICLVHAWINPAHEKRVAEIVRAAGFTQVSVSHEVSPLIKLVSRGATTVADAYLSPVLAFYVENFQRELASNDIQCPRILFMQSNGGLVAAELLRGKDSILSGPAGGVVGMGAAAKRAGFSKLIGFDMGGTSTDASVFIGHPEIVSETNVAGISLRTPMIRIHTIAAGGGSILSFANGRFQAGPESAGADPGPACYGRGGPLTVTDANLLLGRIQANHFPATFGPDADQPLNRDVVARSFADLAIEISNVTDTPFTPQQTALGFLRVAIENMANALRHISIQRGLNPADYTLCCFGGAGGQHACQVADRLGITRILLDPLAGVLSAWGMGSAPLRSYRQQTINRPLHKAALIELKSLLGHLETECRAALHQQGVADACIGVNTWMALKAEGSDTAIELPIDEPGQMQTAFIHAHQMRFGFVPDNPRLIIEALRIEAEDQPKEYSRENAPPVHAVASAKLKAESKRAPDSYPEPVAHVHMESNDQSREVPVFDRADLLPGMRLRGPAIISEQTGTIVVEPEWDLQVNDSLQLLLSRSKRQELHQDIGTRKDPVMLEIFSNHFMHIADEMGVVLQNTAGSVNIKERLDYSCALFSTDGDLIANAPHIPVHLGSMDESIKALLRTQGDGLARGNIYLCNAPYNGGTHLPDLTVVTPVLDTAGELIFVVASRAHHADIGGISPGSMPPESKHIDEEGVVFDNFILVANDQFRATELDNELVNAKYPARNPAQNIADCVAQIAANERGRNLLLEMVDQYGSETVNAYVGHSLDNAEESVREVIVALSDTYNDRNGANLNNWANRDTESDDARTSKVSDASDSNPHISSGSFCYPFDNGQQISVAITLDRDKRAAVIDFSGTSPATTNNLNAPASVCQAAVMYVFRTLVHADIPLNAGCRRPLKLIIPEGCMLNPHYPAAVVGGNVETSQCVTDALYGALGVLAASQGTMNNLSFGNSELQYYETICGGAGAGAGFKGADAVQTHMTNSRMTDAEVLETRYPILVREFSIRRGSGGAGKHRGGDGVIRKLEFRAAMSAAILSNHRRVAPFGLAGGQDAMTGVNELERHNGTVEDLDGIVTIEVQEKDVLIIKTPGGGGYGSPSEST